MIILAELDWLDLWRKLAAGTPATGEGRGRGRGQTEAGYEKRFRKKSERPDPLLDFVIQNIGSRDTFLDVGAGSGRWTVPAAKAAGSVTAVEPSPVMLEMLRENIAGAKLDNVRIVPAGWEEAEVGPHDIVASAHAAYGTPDFAAFVRKMERCATKRCYLALRLPPHDGIIGELSRSIYGHPYDSPNAVIAYNALYSLGIYANVLVEDDIRPWVNSTLEEAFDRARRHLNLESADHDQLIRDTLTRRLKFSNGTYIWPDGMRSALLWWSPAAHE